MFLSYNQSIITLSMANLTDTQLIDKFIEPTKCLKPGHEGLTVQYVQNIGSAKEKLLCQNCVIINQPNEATLVQLKSFFMNYFQLEQQRNRILFANQQFMSAPQDQMDEFDNQMSNRKDDEMGLIEESFVQLIKMTKILFENAKDKFKMVNRSFHQQLKFAQDETKVIVSKNESTLKDQLATFVKNNPQKTNNYDIVKETCDKLMGNSSYASLDNLSVKDMLTKIPQINVERFNRVREEIIEFIKEKLKGLLDFHQIKMSDLSWHSRSAEILAVYEGHGDHVTAMTILPDGTLCSSSKDKTVRTWDVEAHQPKEVIPFHNKNLNAMCTMPDGKLAVAVENLIKFYNVQKEEIEKTLTGHVKPIMCLCPTPEGNLLSGGQDQVIKYWNVKTGQLIKTFYGHDDFVRAIRLTQDGKSFVSASDDKSVKLWDLSTGEIKKSFDSHSDYVYAVEVAKNGHIVTGSRDGTVKIWDPQTEKCLQHIKAHKDFIYSMAILVDGMVATGSSDNSIKIWNPKNGDLMKTLEGHRFPVRGLQVLANGNLASCGEDNLVIVWAAQKLEVLWTFSGHTKAVWSVCGLPKERFVSGSEDRTAKIWDATSGQCISTIQGHREQIRAVQYSKATNQIITACMDKYIRFFNADKYSLDQQILAHSAGVRSLSFTEDFNIISGGEDKLIKIWNKTTYALMQVIEGHDDYIRVVCGLKGARVCSGSRDNTLRIWKNGQQDMILKGHKLPIWSIIDLRDGIVIGTGSSDYTVRIWNLDLQKCESVLQGHTAPVWALIRLNDMLMISGSEDCTLKVWDWDYAVCVRTLLSHSYSVWGLGLTFRDDPQARDKQPLLASGSWDKTVKCWHLKKLQIQAKRQ